jgi:cyclopropane fatty-acyl-phospholipid synthase-like methyltransferase
VFIGKKKSEYYKDILIKADKNLHKDITDSIIELNLDKNINILDFGCGEGALSQRLKDLGFNNIVSVDINAKDFKATTEFKQLNFNQTDIVKQFIYDNIERFDLVLGIEVIEHIENHWEYIKNLKKMVKKNGYILISTPNITSWLSRFHFLFTGRLHQFMENDLSYGHINPISLWQLKYIFKNEDIKFISLKEGGVLPKIYFNGFSIKQIIINIFSLIFTPLMKGEVKYGWCIIIIGQKK